MSRDAAKLYGSDSFGEGVADVTALLETPEGRSTWEKLLELRESRTRAVAALQEARGQEAALRRELECKRELFDEVGDAAQRITRIAGCEEDLRILEKKKTATDDNLQKAEDTLKKIQAEIEVIEAEMK